MIIALVGESASGKTTLANYVSSKGFEDVDLKKVILIIFFLSTK